MDEATEIIVKQLQTDARDTRIEVADVKLSVSKLWTEHRELTATVQGAQGDNGLRSDVRALEEWRAKVEVMFSDLNSNLQHYIDVERVNTCYGKAALAKHLEDHKEEEEENTEVKVAQIQSGGATKVQMLTLIGVLLSPIIMAIATKLLEGVGK